MDSHISQEIIIVKYNLDAVATHMAEFEFGNELHQDPCRYMVEVVDADGERMATLDAEGIP